MSYTSVPWKTCCDLKTSRVGSRVPNAKPQQSPIICVEVIMFFHVLHTSSSVVWPRLTSDHAEPWNQHEIFVHTIEIQDCEEKPSRSRRARAPKADFVADDETDGSPRQLTVRVISLRNDRVARRTDNQPQLSVERNENMQVAPVQIVACQHGPHTPERRLCLATVLKQRHDPCILLDTLCLEPWWLVTSFTVVRGGQRPLSCKDRPTTPWCRSSQGGVGRARRGAGGRCSGGGVGWKWV